MWNAKYFCRMGSPAVYFSSTKIGPSHCISSDVAALSLITLPAFLRPVYLAEGVLLQDNEILQFLDWNG